MLLTAPAAFGKAVVEALAEVDGPANDGVLEDDEYNEQANEGQVDASLLSLCHSVEVLIQEEVCLVVPEV